MWWRKFSVDPGRFSLSDIQNQEHSQSVDIKVEMPWGSEIIETITYTDSHQLEQEDKEIFEAREGRKRILPHLIQSETTIERAVLTYLCDAFEEDSKTGRAIMHFHRKLAPYKTGIALPASSSNNSDLGQLGLLLTLQLRKAGISTILLPTTSTLEEQFVRYDALGLPYLCVLNEATLKTGLIGLRNRETTIKEQVHVSQLVSYMSSLLKNY